MHFFCPQRIQQLNSAGCLTSEDREGKSSPCRLPAPRRPAPQPHAARRSASREDAPCATLSVPSSRADWFSPIVAIPRPCAFPPLPSLLVSVLRILPSRSSS